MMALFKENSIILPVFQERGSHHIIIFALEGFKEAVRSFKLIARVICIVSLIQPNRNDGAGLEVKDFPRQPFILTIKL